MKLIIGLGNPGQLYSHTWHNLGFMTLDWLAKQNDFTKFKIDRQLKAAITIGRVDQEKIILAKPQTYMNASGEAAELISQYYKIKRADLIVIRDDLDLPLGKIRLVKDSSSGGHNGIASIIKNLGSKNFIQMKIGCRTPLTEKAGATDYVLMKIKKPEEKIINQQIEKAAQAILVILSKSLEAAQGIFN